MGLKRFFKMYEQYGIDSEKAKIRMVENNPFIITEMSNVSEEVQLAAVKENPQVISFIDDPTEAVQLAVIRSNTDLIRYIKKPTINTQLEFIKLVLDGNNPDIIYDVKKLRTLSEDMLEKLFKEFAIKEVI